MLVLAAAACVAAPLGVMALSAGPASADITTGLPAPYVTTANGSDPDAEPCTFNGQSGYCLYTSEDLNLPADNHENYYPMNRTMGYFSTDGKFWTSKGAVFTEQKYVDKGWTPSGANHLWAPQMTAANGKYYLLVPDVSDFDESHSSFIGVSTSSSPFGPFTVQSKIRGNSTVNTGYASDPNIVYGGDTGRYYLTYADGDGTNCGGISIGWLNSTFSGFHTGSPKTITVNGANVLGDCGAGRPYMEGPSLYYTPSWNMPGVPGPYLLVFAAKPGNGIPADCNGNGEPSTDNSVIAYATSNTATGEYQYQGILMCGSSAEWTNQASIIPIQTGAFKALVLVYHDATNPGPGKNRTLHGECLFYGAGRMAAAIRTGGTDFSASGAYQCLQNSDSSVFALMSPVNGRVVTGDGFGGGLLSAARIAVGPWEQNRLYSGFGTSPYNIRDALANQSTFTGAYWINYSTTQYVTPLTSGISQLAANTSTSTPPGLPQRFNIKFYSDGTATFFSQYVSSGVKTQSSGALTANGTAERYYVLHY